MKGISPGGPIRKCLDFLRDHSSPGVLIIPQDVAIQVPIEEILMIWAASSADEWVNVLDYLPM